MLLTALREITSLLWPWTSIIVPLDQEKKKNLTNIESVYHFWIFLIHIELFLSNLILARCLLAGSLVEFGQEETQSSIGQLRFHIGLSVSLAPHTGHSLYLRHAGPKRQTQPIVPWEIIYKNLYTFLSYDEHKRRILSSILKNFEKPNHWLVPNDFHTRERNIMEVNGDHQLFDYQHSSKYLEDHQEHLLCST